MLSIVCVVEGVREKSGEVDTFPRETVDVPRSNLIVWTAVGGRGRLIVEFFQSLKLRSSAGGILLPPTPKTRWFGASAAAIRIFRRPTMLQEDLTTREIMLATMLSLAGVRHFSTHRSGA